MVSAILALLVYKRVSNQKGIERVKRRMQASLFEIRLFNDDLRAIVRAQTAFLVGNLRYLALNLKPLLWLLVPFVLVFVHLEPRFRYEGLGVGEPTLIKAQVAKADDRGTDRPDLELDLPAGVRATSPGVWSGTRGEMAWRVVADEAGEYEVAVLAGGVEHAKEAGFTDRLGVFDPERPAPGILGQLAHPAERPLPGDGGLGSITIDYPERSWGRFPGTDIPFAWWFWWLVLMVAFGLLLRGPMGVQI